MTHNRLFMALAASFVLLLALWMRLPELDRFLTPDETRWTCRSANFWNGLATGDLAATYQKEHPGVITMWLGGLGQTVDPEADWAVACREIPMSKLVAEAPRSALDGIRDRLFAGRLRVAIFVSLCIVFAMMLLARLFDPRTALLAGTLLALDPFFIPLGRVLHVDALTSSLMLLSALALLVAVYGRRRRGRSGDGEGGPEGPGAGSPAGGPMTGWLLLSGGLAGLAALAKSPGIFLIPWAGLILGLDAWSRRTAAASSSALFLSALRALPAAIAEALWRLLPWALAAAAAYLAAWPSMWIAPLETLQQVFGGAADYAANPHEGHNYFRGRPIGDPGPAFYAVAWWWRTTPWTLAGLALAAVGAVVALRPGGDPAADAAATSRPGSGPSRDLPALLGLLLFALFFGIFMSLGAKKFDRYLLPAIPPLLVVAAWGWSRGSAWLARRFRARSIGTDDSPALGREGLEQLRDPRGLVALIPWALLLLVLLWTNLQHAPYHLTWFNPLAGGQAAAPETLLVGWGEGTGEPAHWLNERPDVAELEVATRYRSAFGPLFRGRALEMNKIDPATVDYYLFYINQLQRDLDPELIDQFGLAVDGAAASTPRWWAEIEARIADGAQAPVHVTRIDDLVYSLLYENRNWAPAAEAIDQRADPATDVIVTRADSGFAAHYEGPLEVIGIDADAERETILSVLEDAFRAHERVWWVRYDDLIPRPGLDHADHALSVRTFETWSADLHELRVARYERPPGATAVDFRTQVDAPWRKVDVTYGDRLALDGLRLSSEPILWGRGLDVTLRWQALDDLDANYTAFLHLIDPDGRRWAQRDRRIGDERLVPTERWAKGDGAEDTYFLTIPPATPPGQYTLLVGVYDGATGERLLPAMVEAVVVGASPDVEGEAEADNVDGTGGSDPESDPVTNDDAAAEGGEAATDESRPAASARIEADTLAVPVRVGRSPFIPDEDLLGLDVESGAYFSPLQLVGASVGSAVYGGHTVSVGTVWRADRVGSAGVPQGTACAEIVDPDGTPDAPEESHFGLGVDDPHVAVDVLDATGERVGRAFAPFVAEPESFEFEEGVPIRVWVDVPLSDRAHAGEGQLVVRIVDPMPDGFFECITGPSATDMAATMPVTITGPVRSFEPPANVIESPSPVGVRLGDVATLVSGSISPERVTAGDTLTATLVWRAESEPEIDYQAFLHLVAPDGTIVDQRDQAPGGGERPTSSWLVGEYVVGETVFTLPEDAAKGDFYELVIGLYDPADGTRLPIDLSDETKTAIPPGGALERFKNGFILPDHRLLAAMVRVR